MKYNYDFDVLLIDNQGLSHYTSYLAKGISKFRKILLIGLSNEEYRDSTAIKEKNIKFYDLSQKLPRSRSLYTNLIKRPILLFTYLLRFTSLENYRIVHFQGHLPLFFLLIPLIKFRRKKIYWTLHDIDLRPSSAGTRGKVEVLFINIVTQPKFLFRFVDRIFVHGRNLSDCLVERGVDPSKVEVIPHFDYLYLKTIPSSEYMANESFNPYILFFGNIKPYKGIEVLLNAIWILRQQYNENYRLLIAGKGQFTENESKLLKDLPNVIVRNERFPNSCIQQIFDRAKMVILPYVEASQSGVLSLAYTFAKPVIVSDAGSLHEYVDNGVTGFVFKKNNSDQLAQLILKLLKDDKLNAELGRRGYQKLISEMSLEKCCNIIEQSYSNDLI